MIKIHITKDSEVAKLTALGLKERPTIDWRWDQDHKPFKQREYGHEFKTVRTGGRSLKRSI